MSLDTTSQNDIELRFLEQIFEEDCKCESRTHNNGEVICSEDVSYRCHSCKPPINVCTAMGESAILWGAEGNNECADCGEDLEDCWTITPI